jgi:hypothetical protein
MRVMLNVAGVLACGLMTLAAQSRGPASTTLEAAPGPGATLHVELAGADVTIVASDDPMVRVAPQGARDAAAAQGMRLIVDGAVVRLRDAGAAVSPRLRLRVQAPRAMAIELSLRAGDVRLDSLAGRVTARVVRGSIEALGLTGRTVLEVESGPIAARDVRLAGGHSLKCRTFNGDVGVELTESPVSARVLALTLNGAVTSTLPLTTRAAFGPRFAEATIGAGEHVLSIDVVRGDIRIGVRARSGSAGK